MTVGDRMIWLCEARGGYGYIQRVAAEVVAIGPKRVQIEVERIFRTAGVITKRVKERKWVKPDRLFLATGADPHPEHPRTSSAEEPLTAGIDPSAESDQPERR